MTSAGLRRTPAGSSDRRGNSPDLKSELLNAIMGAPDRHNAMSAEALNSEKVQADLKEILLNHAHLWESLRDLASASRSLICSGRKFVLRS